MIRCLVHSIFENQEQWDQDRDWRHVAESGEMNIRKDGEKEIPSEAQLSRETPLPEQELSQDEAQLGEKDDDTSFKEIQSPLNNENEPIEPGVEYIEDEIGLSLAGETREISVMKMRQNIDNMTRQPSPPMS